MHNLLSLLPQFRWQDLVDIALNSYLLFRLYVFFQGTGAVWVLLVIALLWFLQRIALSLGLILTSWVLQGTIAVATLIVIVAFRDEIRSIFRGKNLKAIFWGIPKQKSTTPVEILTKAIFELSKRQFGALIVLPGRDELKGLLQGGLPWEGRLSKEMILSIFWPLNPVHDGAVLIQGKRINRVGLVLPLTRKENLPPDYGTRHRAALGLTERSDALVILVSEERGTILAAKQGHFIPVKQPSTLTGILTNHLGTETKTKKTWKKKGLELGTAAFLSVAFVTSVWFSFSKGNGSLISYTVPIEFSNLPPQTEIISTSINTVQLFLQGSGPLLKSIQPDQIRVNLDLSKALPGKNVFDFKAQNIALPPGVQLKMTDPPLLTVQLDKIESKILPVQVDWTGKIPKDKRLIAVHLDPDHFKIQGPVSLLSKMQTIYTQPIDLKNALGQKDIEATLELPPLLHFTNNSPPQVLIHPTWTKRN